MTDCFKIPIFLSSDNNYIPYAAALIASVCDNTDSFCDFYILDGGITEENRKKIESLKLKFQNFSIEFIKIDVEKYFKDFPVNGGLTSATYLRLLVPEIFSNFEKILYLDSDIIASGDILKLYKEDLETCTIGAVIDGGDKHYIKKLKQNMELNLLSDYFNAGVLLIDCKKWQKENPAKSFFRIKEKYKNKLYENDQDILNKYFENNYKALDSKYNSKKLDKDTILRHFYSIIKPWHVLPEACTGNYSDFNIFWKYAKMTAFYDETVQKCKYTNKLQMQVIKARENQTFKKFNTDSPKVSVIIPVYNAEKYLRRSLNSVIYQTLENIEIICINDSSKDNSLKILEEYKKSDERIKIINFNENKGAAKARNEGINRACGEYIGFVDADDYIDLDFFEKLYKKAKETGGEIIKGKDLTVIHPDKKEEWPQNESIKENKYNFWAQFSTAIYKTSFIKGNNIHFKENFLVYEDISFLLQASNKVKEIAFEEGAKYFYIKHKNGLDTPKYSNDKVNSFIMYAKWALDYITKNPIAVNEKDIILSRLIAQIDTTKKYRLKDNSLLQDILNIQKQAIIMKIRNK